MTTAADLMSEGSFFDHDVLTEFIRLRPKRTVDPYNPENVIVGSWADADRLPLQAYLSSQQSVAQSDPVRVQIVTTKQLILDDPDADVQVGDRISQGDKTWTITGFPTNDVNPWSGWQPTLVVNIEEAKG